MIEAVTVVGDLLRPYGDGRPGGVDRPTLWLWNALKRQINLACGLPVEVLTATGAPALRAWIESLRPQAEADRCWASLYEDIPWSAAFDRLVVAPLRRRFCVGYELPPWLTRLLDAQGVPYVDIRVHPVRFMDDLMFAVRASRPDTQAALLPLAVAESAVIATAGLSEAMCRFITDSNLPDDTLLVVGQRAFDSSQIVGGGFFDVSARTAEIHALCARHPAVVLKPHPFDRASPLLKVAAGAPSRVLGVTSDNVYRLLAQPQISALLTVNSSLAYEAPYFGTRVHALGPLRMRLAWRGAAPDPAAHTALDGIMLAPDFWRVVLAPCTAVSMADGMRLPAKPNRLRIALDSFWNFQELDTDRIPRSAVNNAA
ncbi:MAG TPA: hypothetical protein VNE67_11565 [Acetobacteraceae bacterium]|nr:hypothetical protein [Acetobacteraceae bacterium]